MCYKRKVKETPRWFPTTFSKQASTPADLSRQFQASNPGPLIPLSRLHGIQNLVFAPQYKGKANLAQPASLAGHPSIGHPQMESKIPCGMIRAQMTNLWGQARPCPPGLDEDDLCWAFGPPCNPPLASIFSVLASFSFSSLLTCPLLCLCLGSKLWERPIMPRQSLLSTCP